MNNSRWFAVLATALVVAAPVAAQEEQPPTMVAKNYFLTVFPGQGAQFEAAYKSHVQWHVDNDDDWYWHTWQIENGENMGQYIVRTGDHEWADFDGREEYGANFDIPFWKMVEEVYGDFETDMIRKLWSKSVSAQKSFIAVYRPDLSYNPAR